MLTRSLNSEESLSPISAKVETKTSSPATAILPYFHIGFIFTLRFCSCTVSAVNPAAEKSGTSVGENGNVLSKFSEEASQAAILASKDETTASDGVICSFMLYMISLDVNSSMLRKISSAMIAFLL